MVFFSLTIAQDNDIHAALNFQKENFDKVPLLIYLLMSGELADTLNNLILEKCGGNTALRDFIMASGFNMLNLAAEGNTEDEDEDEDTIPVVDPCSIFKNNSPLFNNGDSIDE
jgi:hypothetical protein